MPVTMTVEQLHAEILGRYWSAEMLREIATKRGDAGTAARAEKVRDMLREAADALSDEPEAEAAA